MLEISEDESMSELYAWHRSYQDAMLELNVSEMPAKFKRAASELRERAQELMFARDAASILEFQAIGDALNNLSAIERSELAPGLESIRLQDACQGGVL